MKYIKRNKSLRTPHFVISTEALAEWRNLKVTETDFSTERRVNVAPLEMTKWGVRPKGVKNKNIKK